jgi:hypothetical protein
MATASSGNRSHLEKLSWYLAHQPHEVWDRFSAEQQEQMIDDDFSAATNVSAILVSLVTTGLLLSIVTVVAVLVMS